MSPELGIIEGFYGKPWTWEEREETVAWLARHGYKFYLYAPKADPYLRRRWQEPYPPSLADRLRSLAKKCAMAGVKFGIWTESIRMLYDDSTTQHERRLAATRIL